MIPNIPWERKPQTPKSQHVKMSRKKLHHTETRHDTDTKTRSTGIWGRVWYGQTASALERCGCRMVRWWWVTASYRRRKVHTGMKGHLHNHKLDMIRLYTSLPLQHELLSERELHKHEEYQLNVPESLWLLREGEEKTKAGFSWCFPSE